MAPMDKALFSGEGAIEGADLGKLQVLNSEEAVDAALKNFGWNGRNPAGCAILNLSADNMSATGGQFAARGRLAKEEVKIDTTKLWREAEPGYLLTLKVPTGGEFTFGGGLCSDYLEASAVDHCITASGRNGQPVLQADYASKGVGAFCLRLVCHIIKATRKSGVTLAYTVLIFPGTGEEVLDVSDLAASPSWPGLKAADGEMALLPLPSAAWGCPVLPLLRTGSPWEDEPTVPPPGELIMRLSWIMATSEPADVCKTKKAMYGRWQRFGDNPDDFAAKKSPLTWPKPQPSRQAGRNIKIQY